MLTDLKLFEGSFPGGLDNYEGMTRSVIEYFKGICCTIDDNTLFELRVILSELVLNAINHGNKGDSGKEVKIVAGVDNEGYAFISVEDCGEGYDCCKIIGEDVNILNPLDLKENGRGMIIVKNLCDRVLFNCKGNRIEIHKKLTKKQI